MVDGFGRKIDYMRISVMDRCNLRCVYCMPSKGVEWLKEEELLTDKEILRIVHASAAEGIRYIKVTGGEPLLRGGVVDLIREIRGIPGIEKVSLTTNGICLPQKIEGLYQAGIGGINISLDTLDAKRYEMLTRGGDLTGALEGLWAALRYEDIVVKVNAVLAKEHWQEDALALTELAEKDNVHIRFIEHMPLGSDAGEAISETQIRELLGKHYGKARTCEEMLGAGPSHYVAYEGLQGRIGFISAMSHKFCSGCNRIRLTADGRLRMCLQSREGVDLRERLRTGASEEEIRACLRDSVCGKPREHQMETQRIEAEGMCQIGG